MRATRLFFLILGLTFASVAPAQMTCRQAQREARAILIRQAEFGEMVLLRPDGFIALYMGGAGHTLLKMQHFSSWAQVENFYQGIAFSEKHFLSNMLTRAENSLRHNYFHLDERARLEGVELRYRLKDISSLKEKIVDRITNFPKEKGREFRVADLFDVIGFRMIAPMNSPFLHYRSAAQWARVLGYAETAIEVHFKGTEEDIQKGRYYTATHLRIIGSDGNAFELQVMSRAMAIWHKWDHPLVYKGHEADPQGAGLRAYSAAWARVIHELTPFAEGRDRSRALSEIAAAYGVLYFAGMTELIPALDRAFRQQWSLAPEQGFSSNEIQQLIQALN